MNQRKIIAMVAMAQTAVMCTSAQAELKITTKTDTPPTHRPGARSDEFCITFGNDEKYGVNMHNAGTDGDPLAEAAMMAAIAKAKGGVLGTKSLGKQIDTTGGEEPHAKLGIPTLWDPVTTRVKQPDVGHQFAHA